MTSLHAEVAVRRGAFALDVALAAHPGEVVAVLGPNGAGKSTLLAVLAGHLVPADGVVRVGERTLTAVWQGRVETDLRPERRSVGLLGQDPLVFPHLSARENVAFAPRAAGVPARDARRSADGWLAAVGLGGLADRRPGELSGGQRQRVALARALAAEPDVLLLDEPSLGLSPTVTDAVFDALAAIRDQGLAVLLVEQRAQRTVALANRSLVLANGQIRLTLTPEDAADTERMIHAYLS